MFGTRFREDAGAVGESNLVRQKMIEEIFTIVPRVTRAGHVQPAKAFGFEDVFSAGLAENDCGTGKLRVAAVLRQDVGTGIGDDELVALGLGLQQIEFRFR